MSDPYIIHSVAAAVQFFSVDIFIGGVFAELVVDLDLSSNTFNQSGQTYASINGNGFTLKGLKHFVGNYHTATFKKITLENMTWLNTYGQQGNSTITFEDVRFIGGVLSCYYGPMKFTRCALSNVSWKYLYPSGWAVLDSVTLPSATYPNPSGFIDLRSVSDPFNPARYPNFNPSIWAIDGASAPRLLKQNVTSLVSGYLVKGIVKLGGVVKSRFVRVLSAVDFIRINDGLAAADGTFSLKCGFYSDVVMVATYEPHGDLPAVNKGYVLGNIIHPMVPNGFRYLCTKAGNSGAVLPPEPWPTSAILTIGAAIFTPDPVYQPQLHGPIKPVLCNLITGQPV